jgi:hypothetical protein
MAEDTEELTIFLHQVRIGDLFYAGPAIRAWIVGCEDDEARLQPVEVPVERSGLRARTRDVRSAWPEPPMQSGRRRR